jgi:uncharacterized protein (TIGR03118 family)
MKTAAGVASVVLSLLATSALAAPRPLSDAQMSQIVAGEKFNLIDVISDALENGGPKFTVTGEISDTLTESGNPPDPLLQNSWGLSEAPAGGPLWVSDNGTGFATLYNFSNFSKIALNVMIPGAGGAQGSPTGTTFTDATSDFQVNLLDPVTHTTVSTHSLFLFDSEDGIISGWGIPAPNHFPTQASIAVDESATGASFKGLTLAFAGVGGTAPELFAADFTNNQVEVFDGSFTKIGSFTDPTLPPGYAPFNVQELNGKIYVAYALRQSVGHDEVDGRGLGFVDVFDLQGNKISTLVSNGRGSQLNAPWGLTIAPASFGKFAGALLVGNFGDGAIHAYDPNTGRFLGTLKASGEKSIIIDGLWALRDGPDGSVVFSSGPNSEANGLVGVIRPANAAASWAYQSHVVLGH